MAEKANIYRCIKKFNEIVLPQALYILLIINYTLMNNNIFVQDQKQLYVSYFRTEYFCAKKAYVYRIKKFSEMFLPHVFFKISIITITFSFKIEIRYMYTAA